ncbi:MAG TPA: peptidylprolyl isomerase [Blastocatellia bacterium]|nr:peptidylprolyl isomerase [Blastocatellia bacterium]
MKTIFIAFLLGVFAFACSENTAGNNNSSSTSSTMPTPKPAGPPVLDDEVAVFETDYGNFKIALYPDVAPRHVENFKKLINEKFYDGLGFHRVLPDFIIQGGDPQTRGGGNRAMWGSGDPNQPRVPAEFSTRPYIRGTVGAARANDPNSASSQFFICLRPNPEWNGKYTVFGEVIQGLSNVQIISNVPLEPGKQDEVKTLPVIKRAYLEKRQQ